MNTSLPRLPITRRFIAFAAAVLVTVSTLVAIDRLAAADGGAPLLARVQASATV